MFSPNLLEEDSKTLKTYSAKDLVDYVLRSSNYEDIVISWGDVLRQLFFSEQEISTEKREALKEVFLVLYNYKSYHNWLPLFMLLTFTKGISVNTVINVIPKECFKLISKQAIESEINKITSKAHFRHLFIPSTIKIDVDYSSFKIAEKVLIPIIKTTESIKVVNLRNILDSYKAQFVKNKKDRLLKLMKSRQILSKIQFVCHNEADVEAFIQLFDALYEDFRSNKFYIAPVVTYLKSTTINENTFVNSLLEFFYNKLQKVNNSEDLEFIYTNVLKLIQENNSYKTNFSVKDPFVELKNIPNTPLVKIINFAVKNKHYTGLAKLASSHNTVKIVFHFPDDENLYYQWTQAILKNKDIHPSDKLFLFSVVQDRLKNFPKAMSSIIQYISNRNATDLSSVSKNITVPDQTIEKINLSTLLKIVTKYITDSGESRFVMNPDKLKEKVSAYLIANPNSKNEIIQKIHYYEKRAKLDPKLLNKDYLRTIINIVDLHTPGVYESSTLKNISDLVNKVTPDIKEEDKIILSTLIEFIILIAKNTKSSRDELIDKLILDNIATFKEIRERLDNA